MDDSFAYLESFVQDLRTTYELPANSPMSHTKITQLTKISNPFVDPDQSETGF